MIRWIKRIFIILLLGVLLTPFGIVIYYLIAFDYELESLINYKPDQTTQIYDRHGEKIANLFDTKHRYYAPFSEIPPQVIETLIAVEDTAFFEHPGINVDAIFRAAIKVLKAGSAVEGASTITQQLVKNVILSREKKLSRKIKEAIYAIKIEQVLSKEEILERYLNEIYFGHGYYGIKTAAAGYFRKSLSDLTLKEIAILVGLPKAPSSYAPTKNYEISIGRANRVVTRLHMLGWIDDEAFEEALAQRPLVYDDTLTQNKAPFVVEEVMRQAKERGIEDIKTAGYEIHTTINLSLQELARESLKYGYDLALERIAKYQEKEMAKGIDPSQLNGALISVEPQTGDILALIGSVDYSLSSYNRATQGKRLPGSAFKPFIYQVAIDLGYSGATSLVDIARTYAYKKDGEEQKWQPKNYKKNYKGLLSLREALVTSNNLATINLVNDIGLNQLLKELKRFGITNLPRDLSLALGTITLSPMELAKYYTSFSNAGVQVELNLINSIHLNKKIVYEKEIVQKVVSAPEQAFIMTTILRDAVDYGTGKNARVEGIEIAGKTGTTNNNVDGWFAGYSPTIQTIVWFGHDDNTPMHKLETGGKIAGPVFAKFYENVIRLYPQIQRRFEMPAGIVEVVIDKRKEYFSDISKPPPQQEEGEILDDELLF
jgi:penicillin-binding protein 1A